MLSADIVARHGEELHTIRPDRVYGTGVLTAIPGFQPVRNAQDVAQRFTAIWPPRVTDVPVDPGNNGVPSTQTVTATSPPVAGHMMGLGAAKPGLMTRFRIWKATRQMTRALRAQGIHGLRGPITPDARSQSLVWMPQHGLGRYGFGSSEPGMEGRGPAPTNTALPVVGGWAPQPQNAMQMGLQISQGAVNSRTSSPFAPVFEPQMAMALQKTPGYETAQSLADLYQQQGSIGVRAKANAMHDFYTARIDQPWGR